MSIGRYNLRNKKDQARARYDAELEAARREQLRRQAVAISSVVPPTFRGAALELQTILGRYFEVIIKGPAECVAGETRILDPRTGIEAPIAALAALGAPITVLTQFGPQTIAAPFRKGYTALYRVTCENGNSFVATAKHRVLTDQGWCFVGDLCAGRTSLQTPLASNVVHGPLTYPQGDQHSSYRVPDYQYDYQAFLSYGVPLLAEQDNDLNTVPLLNDVPVHNHDYHSKGDQVSLAVYNRLCQLSNRHANVHFDHPYWYTLCKGYAHQVTNALHGAYSSAYGVQSPQVINPVQQDQQVALNDQVCYDYPYSNVPYSKEPFTQYTASQSLVSSVTFERYDDYYDMSVPQAAHYYAHGFWHHNTGKTYAACYFVDWVLRTYPNVQAVLARKVRDTIVPTVLQTYLKIVAGRADVVSYGGKKPEWFDYSNNSRLWLAGLDDPGKALSSERDLIYINQCEELHLNDWEVLATRATGRASNLPNGMSLILGDANPGPKNHWTTQRKTVHVMRSVHKDNPTLYDDAGKPTERGVKTISILSSLSEPRRSRLFLGLDVSAEGVVYATYDADKHLITRCTIPSQWPCIRVIDFGFNNPFVCSWYALDTHTNRLYRYREIYLTHTLVEDHARVIAQQEGWEFDVVQRLRYWHRPVNERENIIATICDHDAEDRATLIKYGIDNIPAFKAIKLGIEAVQDRLRYRVDTDDYGIYFMQDSLVEVDQTLIDAYLPTCTEEEIEGYVWEQGKDGKPAKELPIDKNNHGMDTLRYAVAFVDSVGIELNETDTRIEYEDDYEISPI